MKELREAMEFGHRLPGSDEVNLCLCLAVDVVFVANGSGGC